MTSLEGIESSQIWRVPMSVPFDMSIPFDISRKEPRTLRMSAVKSHQSHMEASFAETCIALSVMTSLEGRQASR